MQITSYKNVRAWKGSRCPFRVSKTFPWELQVSLCRSVKNMGSNAADVLGQFHLSGINVGSFLRSVDSLAGPLFLLSPSFPQSKTPMTSEIGKTTNASCHDVRH